jgi:hypothetical protein
MRSKLQAVGNSREHTPHASPEITPVRQSIKGTLKKYEKPSSLIPHNILYYKNMFIFSLHTLFIEEYNGHDDR